jgi:hypothetical protein
MMKVFEVIYERDEDGKIIQTCEYVTNGADDIAYVCQSYDAYCSEAGHNLLSVRYVLTVCRDVD